MRYLGSYCFRHFFSHNPTVPGSDKELNDHFYSAALLTFHTQYFFVLYHTQLNYILVPGRLFLSLKGKYMWRDIILIALLCCSRRLPT